MKPSRHALITLALIACGLTATIPAADVAADEGDRSLQEVMDAWADASGGRDRLARVETWHIQGKTSMFGLDGSTDEWYTPDGHHRLDLDLAGLFKITIVRTPEHCWFLDQNGKVSDQAGKDLQDEITSVYLSTFSHLVAGRMAGEVALAGTDTETGHIILTIAPEGGTESMVFLDPETFLPATSQMVAHAGRTLTTTFGDWREFDGIVYATTIHQSTGVPQNDASLELVSVEHNLTPPEGAFDRPGETADDTRFANGDAALDIPVDLHGVHIFLQGRINDSEPLWFVLDTGASITVIDSKLATDLGFELEGEIMGGGAGEGMTEVNLIKDVTYSVEGVEITNQTIAAIALGDILEARIGRPVDGILGYDFISRFVVEIDYAGALLDLHPRDGWTYEGDGSVVPIRLVGSQPHCDVTITVGDLDPITCDLLVDIGSGGALNFSKPFTEEHGLLAALKRKVPFSGGYGIGGESRSILGRIDNLRIGKLDFAAPFAGFSRDERGAGADASSAGLLGGRILEQCTVIFDYERERMILEPNVKFGSAIHFDMSGMVCSTGGRDDWHTFTVQHIVEDGPADKAGLKVGDVIETIDGKPTQELWTDDLIEIFRSEGRKVRLEIVRGGKTLAKEMVLEPLI